MRKSARPALFCKLTNVADFSGRYTQSTGKAGSARRAAAICGWRTILRGRDAGILSRWSAYSAAVVDYRPVRIKFSSFPRVGIAPLLVPSKVHVLLFRLRLLRTAERRVRGRAAAARSGRPSRAALLLYGHCRVIDRARLRRRVLRASRQRYKVSPPPIGSTVSSLPSGAVDHNIHGTTYFVFDGAYYRPFYSGSSVIYEVVAKLA